MDQSTNYENYLAQNPGAGAAPSQGGGFDFASLLPTGGSILGGILGSDLGPLGTVGGSALGSALGKGAEDMFDPSHSQGGIGGAALSGAIGGGLGLGAGALLGKLGGGLVGSAEKAAQDSAIQGGVGQLSGKTLTKLNAPDLLAWAKENGIDLSPSGLQGTSMAANGPEGAYNNVIKEALDANNPELNLDQIKNNAISAIGKKTILGNPALGQSNDATALQAQVNDLLDPLANPLRNEGVEAPDARQVLQNVGSEAANYRQIAQNALRNGTDNTIAKSKSDVLSGVYNDLKSQLYNGDVNKFVADYQAGPGSVNYQNVLNAAGGDEKLAAQFANTINNASSAQDLLDPMSKLAGLGKLGKLGEEAQGVAAIKGSGAPDTSSMTPTEMAAASVGGHHTLIPAVLKKILNPGTLTAIAGKTGKAANTPLAKGAAAAVAQLIAHAPNDFNSGAGGPAAGGVGGAGAPGQSLTGALGGSPMQNQQGQPMLANGQPQNIPNILSQLDTIMATDPYIAGSIAPQVAALAPQAQSAQAAQQALNQYLQTLQASGGAQGPLGGILARISSALTGGPASQLGAQQQAAQALMAKAGAPNVQLPGLYSNQAGAQAGINQAQGILGALGGQ